DELRRLASDETVTDAEGRFSLHSASSDPQRLDYLCRGYVASVAHDVRAGLESVLLELIPTGSVAGQVVDEQGEAIADAQLVAGLVGRLPISEEPIARTGADGTFHSDGAPATLVALTALHDRL